MIRAHVDVFKDALQAKPSPTYDGAAPDDAVAPYTILHSDDGPDGDPLLDGRRSLRTWTITTQHFGEYPTDVRYEAERTAAQVQGKRLTVAGRRCTRTQVLTSQGMRLDDSVAGQRLFYTVTVWRFASTSA